MSAVARHVHVSGRVQGVAFRWATQDQAQALGLAGWVRNLADGRVEAWIQGAPDAVDGMLEWIATGPPMARVDGVDVAVREATPELDGFEIRATGRA